MPATIHYARRRLARLSAPARLAELNGDEFEGYASLFGVPDSAGDVVAKGGVWACVRNGTRIRNGGRIC